MQTLTVSEAEKAKLLFVPKTQPQGLEHICFQSPSFIVSHSYCQNNWWIEPRNYRPIFQYCKICFVYMQRYKIFYHSSKIRLLNNLILTSQHLHMKSIHVTLILLPHFELMNESPHLSLPHIWGLQCDRFSLFPLAHSQSIKSCNCFFTMKTYINLQYAWKKFSFPHPSASVCL